jgi:GrpB-like predicted nucleotidyltransferase (UPF0157 family)
VRCHVNNVTWKFAISEPDPAWPARYEVAVAELQPLLPMAVAFEHVGSTSIPRMPAVPTIDILAGVLDLRVIDATVRNTLVTAGWEHRPDVEDLIPRRRFFNRPVGSEFRTTRTHHLHVVELDSAEWCDPIDFRDFLRHDDRAARRYLELKRSLASREYENPSDYSAQKEEFVNGILLASRRQR